MKLQKIPFLIFFIFSSFLFLPHCAASPFPDKRPEDFKVEIGYGGGMRNAGWEIKVSKEGGVYEDNDEGVITTTTFSVTSEQLDNVFNVIKKNRFDKIKISNVMAYDAAGYHIRVSWKGFHKYIGTSGTEIEKQWEEEWQNIIKALEGLH